MLPRVPFILALQLPFVWGCMASSYRYMEVSEPSGPVLQGIADRARDRGLVVDAARESLGLSRPAEPAETTVPPTPPTRPQMLAEVRVADTGAGSRVEVGQWEVSEDTEAVLEPLGEAALTVDVTRPGGELGWHDRFLWEYSVAAGAMGGPWGNGATWRVEGMARLGSRLASLGGGVTTPAWRTGLGLLGGVGFSGTPWEAWFRPEVALTLDWQRTVEPVRGRRLPVGDRLVLDLGLAPLVGLDHGRHGLEVGLTLRHGAWGGILARAGYLWGEQPGFTWTLGASLGTQPSAVVTVATLLIGALIGAAMAAVQDGVGDVLGGG